MQVMKKESNRITYYNPIVDASVTQALFVSDDKKYGTNEWKGSDVHGYSHRRLSAILSFPKLYNWNKRHMHHCTGIIIPIMHVTYSRGQKRKFTISPTEPAFWKK